ncbi:MAG TPA: CHAT domain-containing protein [Gemmatimonadales bacterium]|nr:CHAT domain-containing protein [Gemmatimonadales bacterium]
MRILLAILSFVLGPPAGAQSPDDPRTIVLAAERAVTDDSAGTPGARWRAALARDSSDRTALLGLATLARMTYDFPTAERVLGRLLGQPATAPDRWQVQARLGLYRVAFAQGDDGRARGLLDSAVADARRIGDRGGEADAMMGFTSVRGPAAAALLTTLDTLDALLPPGDGRDRAESLCRRGLYTGIGGDTSAIRMIRGGIEMAERVGERRLTGHCLEAYGLVHSVQGHADSVLPIYQRAEALLRATHDHSSLARLESRRSDEFQARGWLGEAKLALSRVLAEAEISHNRQRSGYAYAGLGMLALRVGDLPTAARRFEQAATLYDSLGNGEGAMISRQNRAEVMEVTGDLAGARDAFQQSLEEAEQGEFFEDAVIMRQHLARIAIRLHDWSDAERQLAFADSAAHVRGLEQMRGSLVYDRARLAIGQGRLPRAAGLLDRLLRDLAPDDQLPRYTARLRLAEVRARQGNLDRAQAELTRASRELEAWRATLRDAELRQYAFAATTLGETDPQAPVATVLAALARGGRVDAAFALAEQRRARTLAERLEQAQALATGSGSSHREALAPGASGVDSVSPVTDSGTALLEYVAGSDGAPTTLFVLTRSGSRAFELPPADSLAPSIARLVALLESGAPGQGPARALGATLLGAADSALTPEITRLVVVPDGPLHRVPFDALRLADGRAAVERWAIGVAPSAAVASAIRRRPEPSGADSRLLALGDPVFTGPTLSLAMRDAEPYRSAFDRAGGLTRLTGSGDEAREVARYAPAGADVRLREEASESWLKRADLGRYRVIHLATHALVDETSLANTVLALSPGGDDDGFVSPGDLAALHLDADLVVLSACRTAGGVTVAGEGVQGLTTPLLAAGARAVVATQWRIGDRSTVRLVDDLYAALARGQPVADALREAKLAALRRGAPAGEWAGFTVVGDPLVRVPLAVPKPTGEDTGGAARAAAALALLAAAAALIYRAITRRRRSSERGPGPGESAITHH